MSDQTVPDMNDPDVRSMVLNSHEPKDHWMISGRFIGVYCTVCGHTWPCPSILAAQAAEEPTP
jgi:hypothetical protein